MLATVAAVINTEKDLEMKFSFSRGWYQNKTNDGGLLDRQGRNKICAIHHSSFLQSKRKPPAPRPMSHAMSHPGTQSMPRGILLALLIARSDKSGLEATQGALQFSRDIPRNKWFSPHFSISQNKPQCVVYQCSPGERVNHEEHSSCADSVQIGPSSRYLEQSQWMMLLLTLCTR